MITIPIFFAADDAYAPFLAAALASAVDNCSEDRCYLATVLYEKLSDKNIRRIASLERDNFKIDFVPMTSGLETITDRLSNRLRYDCFTLTIYFRLFIPEMFPQYDKAIYIDSDVIVKGDLAELFDTDIKDSYIGACTDLSIQENTDLTRYIKKYVGVDSMKYINSGVLLMNLDKMRKNGFTKHFLSLLNTYHFDSVAPDQDYLNAICNGSIHYLDSRWNTMPDSSKPPVSDPKLIHYNLYLKPWYYSQVQYADSFFHYAGKSGFSEEIRCIGSAYTDEDKAFDTERMATLVRRAVEMTGNAVSFKNITESGVKIRL